MSEQSEWSFCYLLIIKKIFITKNYFYSVIVYSPAGEDENEIYEKGKE